MGHFCFEWQFDHIDYSNSGGYLVGIIGYGRWIVVRTSHLVMLICYDVDDGLTVALKVYNMIILINGMIWNSYGSVDSWVINHLFLSVIFL